MKNLFILLLILFINPLQAQTAQGTSEKGIISFLQELSVEDNRKLYELTLRIESKNLATRFKAAAVFGTVYELAEYCYLGDKLTCDMSAAILNDSKDECQKFSPENNLLCSDVRNIRLNQCEIIKDPFLASVCLKKLLPACRSDVVCLIAWSFSFREDPERLKTSSPTIVKVFNTDFIKSKELFLKYLKILPQQKIIKTHVVEAPGFPAPERRTDFFVSKKVKLKAVAKNKPNFKPMSIQKGVFSPGLREMIHPWTRGEGLTVVDWDGDGFLDVFTVDGENIIYFKNINGSEFKKFSINFPSSGLKGFLIDISVADLDDNGVPVILVQSYPKTLYVLRWSKESNSFLTEIVTLPNQSRTHAFIKFKSGLGIVFPGWSAITSAPSPATADYIARYNKRVWTFEKLPSSEASSLGVSVVENAAGQSTLVINRDLEGGTDFYKIHGDKLVKLPDTRRMNYFSHSAALLRTSKNEDLWVTSGIGGLGKDSESAKREGQAAPGNLEECQNNWKDQEKEFCVMRFSRNLTRRWPSLCALNKNPDTVKICLAQNETPGIRGVKMPNPFKFKLQFFKNLAAPVVDETATKLGSEMGQIWHISPLQSPLMEGFLMSEARTDGSKARKLWWMGVGKTRMEKAELTNSLGLQIPYDATHFALGDFDKDGQLDMAFKSGNDMVFLKGDTGGNSSLTKNLQSGHQSRTLIKIPVNSRNNFTRL